jgi:hypothetical protein
VLAAVAVLTALFSAAAAQVASAGGLPGVTAPTALPALPLVSLGPIKVAGGVASLTGTVNTGVHATVGTAASAAAKVQVTVNGSPVTVSATGNFSATANVAAQGAVVVRAGSPSGLAYTITVPASAIPSNGVAADALAQLDVDQVTLMLPPDGFTIVDGVRIRASVQVGQITGIAKLTLNGADILARLQLGSSSGTGSTSGSGSTGSGSKPGGAQPGKATAPAHATASAPVTGTAKTVQLTVTGSNGAQQTTTVPVRRIRSVIRIGKQISISAFGARGLRISAVTFAKGSAMCAGGRLGVGVTVRDRRGYLVRDAVVILQPAAARVTIHNSFVRMSGMLGRATFSVPVAASALGHRLYLKVVARTPLASTHVTASTMLTGGAA